MLGGEGLNSLSPFRDDTCQATESAETFLACLNQILILRVSLQIRRYKWAARHDFQFVLSRVIQGRFGKLAADSLPFHFRRNFRMNQVEGVAILFVGKPSGCLAKMNGETMKSLLVLDSGIHSLLT